ncbi:MAG TPA: GNAT family N-acetyltransferase [Gemmatimonadaceae bacterium]
MGSTNLDTSRLTLRAWAAEHLIALIERPAEFALVAGFPAAAGLRDFFTSGEVDAEWIAALKTRHHAEPWSLGFAVCEKSSGLAVGTGGFKGAPDDAGVAEIAYGIVPDYEGKGYATEVADALTSYSIQSGVRTVRAHTLPEPNASNHILTKLGFTHVGDFVDPQDGLVWRWER